MDFNKIKKVCSNVRIVVGLVLIIVAAITDIRWFYLGIIPLITGIVSFCPICLVTDKCDLPQDGAKNESN